MRFVGRLTPHKGIDVLIRAVPAGDNARQLAVERFTWQACAQRFLAAYPPVGAR